MSLKSITGWVLSAVMYIVYVAIILTYPVGLFHSYKQHSTKDLIFGAIAFPWAMYRGVEMFWHKDDDGVDWNKKLASDIRSSIYLFNEGSYKDGNVSQVNSDIEQFSNRVNEYPADKKKYLMTASKAYIRYMLSVTHDSNNSMNAYFNTGVYEVKFSDSSNKFKSDLIITYKLNDLIEPMEALVKQQANDMKRAPVKDTSSLVNMKASFKEKMDIYMPRVEADMKRIYKNIFNEEY